MKNIKSTIEGHTSWMLSGKVQQKPSYGCNCRDKESCPLEENCHTTDAVYKAEIINSNVTQTYIDMF